jgi:uncharacterized protein YfaA (DUF2138 family)
VLKVVRFADNSNLIIKSKDPKTVSETITAELVHISNWFCSNKLLLNAGKTKVIVFKIRKCRMDLTAPPILLDNKEQKQVPSKGFLGVQFDEILKWYERTCKVANSISTSKRRQSG